MWIAGRTIGDELQLFYRFRCVGIRYAIKLIKYDQAKEDERKCARDQHSNSEGIFQTQCDIPYAFKEILLAALRFNEDSARTNASLKLS